MLETIKHFCLLLLAGVICYALWFAAMYGLFGPFLTPHGEDKAKLAAVQNVMDRIQVGTPEEEAKSVLKTYTGGTPEASCPRDTPQDWHCSRPVSPSDYRMVSSFKDVAWEGTTSWSDTVVVKIRDGVVVGISRDRLGFGL
jgi:hypothetical protein